MLKSARALQLLARQLPWKYLEMFQWFGFCYLDLLLHYVFFESLQYGGEMRASFSSFCFSQ